MSQVMEFSAFLCMGRCKSLGSLKSFLWYVPHLSRASILYFHILSFLRLTIRSGFSLWLLNGRYSFSFWVSSGLSAHGGGLQSLMTVTSLFTDMAGNISQSLHILMCIGHLGLFSRPFLSLFNEAFNPHTEMYCCIFASLTNCWSNLWFTFHYFVLLEQSWNATLQYSTYPVGKWGLLSDGLPSRNF